MKSVGRVAKNLLFRADGDATMGIGHIMRCLALAEAAQEQGIACALATAAIPPALETRIKAVGCSVIHFHVQPGSPADATATSAVCKDFGAHWVVVDGTALDETYQVRLRSAAPRLLLMHDGKPQRLFPSDIIVNPNIEAEPGLYQPAGANATPIPRLALGLGYMPLQREFRALTPAAPITPSEGGRVLVTLGGADPDGMTGRILDLLAGSDLLFPEGPMRVTAVTGPLDPRAAAIARRWSGRLGFDVCHAVSDMASVLARHDIVIAAGGRTVWEAMHMGAAVIGITRDPLQQAMMAKATAKGLTPPAFDAGTFDVTRFLSLLRSLIEDPAFRQSWVKRGQAAVDGDGARRCLEMMAELG